MTLSSCDEGGWWWRFPVSEAGHRSYGQPGGAGSSGPPGLLRSAPAGTLCPAGPSLTRSWDARGGGPGALECAPRGTPSPGVDPTYRGVGQEAVAAEKGRLGLERRALAGRLQTSHFGSERCISHMVVGDRSGDGAAFGALESHAFKGRGSLSPCPIADPQTPFSNLLTPTEFRETVWHN